jgi:hypothetical protein
MVGVLLEALQANWTRTLVIVVSDHDMAPCGELEPVDLMADPRVQATAEDIWLDRGGLSAGLVTSRPHLSDWAAPIAQALELESLEG